MVETFGQFIRRVREERGLSGRKVEQVTSGYLDDGEGERVSSPYLSQIERGLVPPPSPGKVWSLAKCLEIPFQDLMVRAGHIPAELEVKSGPAEREDQLVELARQAAKLSPEGRASVESFLRWAIGQDRQDGRGRRREVS